MSNIEFVIPIKIDSKLSLNSIYSANHWACRERQSKQIHKFVRLSLLAQKISKKLFENPVEINFCWNSKLDLDNHGYLTKLIIDALKGYLIKDDTKKYISQISHQYWDEKGVKINIKELEGISNEYI